MKRPELPKTVCATAMTLALAGAFGPAAAFAADANVTTAATANLQTVQSETDDDDNLVNLDDFEHEIEQDQFFANGKPVTPSFTLITSHGEVAELPENAYTITYQKQDGEDDYGDEKWIGIDSATDAGSYRIVLTGNKDAGFTGTLEIPFWIYDKNDISHASMTITNGTFNPYDADDPGDYDPNDGYYSFDYTGDSIKPVFKLKLVGKTLSEGTDFSVVGYAQDQNGLMFHIQGHPKEAGLYQVTFEGKGAYKGIYTDTFRVDGNDSSDDENESTFRKSGSKKTLGLMFFTRDGRHDYLYTGSRISPKPWLVDADNGFKTINPDTYESEYARYVPKYDWYEPVTGAPVSRGEYKVSYVAKKGSGYTGRTGYVQTLRISDDNDLNHAGVVSYWDKYTYSGAPHVSYTGKPAKLGIRVTLPNGKVAKEGKDYKILYRAAESTKGKNATEKEGTPVNAGYYRLVLKGINAYKGQSCSFDNRLYVTRNDAGGMATMVYALPNDNLTLNDAWAVSEARKAYNKLSAKAKKQYEREYKKDKLRGYEKLKNLEQKIEKLRGNKITSQTKKAAKHPSRITVNSKNVTAKVVDKSAKKAKFSKGKVTTIVLGSKVKSIAKGAFNKYKKATTLQVQTKKLSKKSVKNTLKSSNIKTVEVKVSKKAKTNKKYVKTYKKVFTKTVTGKKVKVVLLK